MALNLGTVLSLKRYLAVPLRQHIPIQRRLAWPLRKDDMQIREAFRIFSPAPGWMHEKSAQGWYTGKTQRDGMEREVGGGIGMGNTCKSVADSCQCMAKTTTILLK